MKYLGFSESQEVIFVRGHPGSGKSTLSNLFELNGYQAFENDSYFTDDYGTYKFVLEDHQKAKDECLKKAKKALDKGCSIVVSNTFTKIAEMAPFIEHAQKLGVPFRVIEMELNFDNVHNVPDFVVEDKKKQFEPYEGAIKIDDPQYNIVRQQDVKSYQIESDIDSFKGESDIPEFYVADSINKIRKIVSYMKEDLIENGQEYKDDGIYAPTKKDLKVYEEIVALFDAGKAVNAVNKLELLEGFNPGIPPDIVVLSGQEVFDEKSNSSRFNDMTADEIKEKFIEIVAEYKNNPEKAKQMDSAFSKEFFVDAEMMIKFEETRRRRLGY